MYRLIFGGSTIPARAGLCRRLIGGMTLGYPRDPWLSINVNVGESFLEFHLLIYATNIDFFIDYMFKNSVVYLHTVKQ